MWESPVWGDFQGAVESRVLVSRLSTAPPFSQLSSEFCRASLARVFTHALPPAYDPATEY